MAPEIGFLAPLVPRAPTRRSTSSLSRFPPPHCCTLIGLEGAPHVVRRLNTSHVKELAVLMSNFGKNKYKLDVLTSVQATKLDEAGLSIEAVLCDGEGCVGALEVLSWPGEARVGSIDEALQKLREMFDVAGLDGDKVLDVESVK